MPLLFIKPLPMDLSRSIDLRGVRWVRLFGLALILTLTLGCKELSKISDGLLNEDCTADAEALSEALESEGGLTDTIPEEAPYPMSMIVSQDALNRLFADVADQDLSPIELPVGDIAGFEITIKVSPDLPLIQIEDIPNCETCIVTEVEFGLAISVGVFEAGATGTARYQFPVRMEAEGMEATRVFGDFDRSEFQSIDIRVSEDLDIDIPFVDVSTNDVIDLAEPYIVDYVNELVQEEYGAVELFKLEPWEIGNGDVKLLARGPILSPENRTIVLGIHTNLVQPLDSSVGLEPALPDGADIGLQFHPELIQVMVQRMMHEGHVSRSYDEDGKAEPQGGAEAEEDQDEEEEGAFGVSSLVETGFDVTLSTLEQSEAGDDLLSVGFTLWRTQGGICGSAELKAELGASVGDAGIALTAQEIRIEKGEGLFGALAEGADQWLNSDFMKDVVDISEFTLNYDELNLPNNKKAQMSAETFRLELGGNGFNIFLNLNGVVEQTSETTSTMMSAN
jgi:hypothetical protein